MNKDFKGGWFFNSLYDDAYSIETIRKTPSTIDELKSAGLSDEKITEYFSLIKQLYGELYLSENHLLPTDNINSEVNKVWKELTDFCLNHSLTYVLDNDEYEHLIERIPLEISLFDFIWCDENCEDYIFLGSLEDFRYEVEMQLAQLTIDWYLALRYDVRILGKVEKDEMVSQLIRYDQYSDKMILLSEDEASFLLNKIRHDLSDCEKRIKQHEKPVSTQKNNSTYNWNQACQNWFKKSIELRKEFEALEENEQIISDIIESGVHDGIITEYPDDTLYVHKGRIKCERDNHPVEQATAILIDKYGSDIELNVSHCLKCNKFFIHYNVYQHYRKEYGTILGNIHMAKNGEFYKIGYDLADESPLKLCGYSVNSEDNLPQWERQGIIASCIESGAMTKDSVIRLLRWLTTVNGNKSGNESAYKKWCEDLDFALAYNTPNQNKYHIKKITRYSRNRFVTNRTHL